MHVYVYIAHIIGRKFLTVRGGVFSILVVFTFICLLWLSAGERKVCIPRSHTHSRVDPGAVTRAERTDRRFLKLLLIYGRCEQFTYSFPVAVKRNMYIIWLLFNFEILLNREL